MKWILNKKTNQSSSKKNDCKAKVFEMKSNNRFIFSIQHTNILYVSTEEEKYYKTRSEAEREAEIWIDTHYPKLKVFCDSFYIYSYMWNISQMLEWVKENLTPVIIDRTMIIRTKEKMESRIYTDKLEKADVTKPIIYIEFGPKRNLLLVDGNHRILKAFKEDIQSMQAYIIPYEIHPQFLWSYEYKKRFKEQQWHYNKDFDEVNLFYPPKY